MRRRRGRRKDLPLPAQRSDGHVAPIQSSRSKIQDPIRRLLLITYYFPPSGGSGVQRALKFAKYLPEAGWQPTVLTVRTGEALYPDLDPSLEREVPAALQVERTKAWDPYALYARLVGKEKSDVVSVGFTGTTQPGWKQKVARWIRANVFLPDARVGWVPFALRRGRELLEEGGYEAVFTTGPPHSAHLIGRFLAPRFKLPWVADFRDPWTEIDYADELPVTDVARWLDSALERSVLREASAVTVVTPSWRRDLERRVGARYQVICNGYDPADFTGEVDPDPEFVVGYLGNLNEARSPTALWQALGEMEAAVHMPGLRVRFIGNVDPAALAGARRHGVEELVDVRPYVPHDEAVREMQRSSVLLLLINRAANRMGIIPGKVYEYVAAGRPVLGIGPPEGDAAAVLRDVGAGSMVDFEDVEGVKHFLIEKYQAWAEGRALSGASPEAAQAYSRKAQTGELAALLHKLADEAKGA